MDISVYYLFIVGFLFYIVKDGGQLLEIKRKQESMAKTEKLMLITIFANIFMLLLFSYFTYYFQFAVVANINEFQIVTRNLFVLVIVKMLLLKFLEIFYFKLSDGRDKQSLWIVFMVYCLIQIYKRYIV